MKPKAFALIGSLVLLLLVVTYWAVLERKHATEARRTLAELTEKHQRLQNDRDDPVAKPGSAQPAAAAVPEQALPARRAIPTAEDNSDGTIERVGQLKRTLLLHPEFGLPEFDLLTDDDWLEAAKRMPRDTEIEARLALAQLRQIAKQKFLPDLRAAIRAYELDHGGQRPADLRDLAEYLPNPVRAGILDRYEVWSGEFMGTRDWYLRERVFTDPWFDGRLYVGSGSRMGMESAGLGNEVLGAAQQFRNAHGREPRTAAQLRPYLDPSVSDELLNEIFAMLHGP